MKERNGRKMAVQFSEGNSGIIILKWKQHGKMWLLCCSAFCEEVVFVTGKVKTREN